MHWPSPFLATVFLRPWPWPWEGEEGSKGGKGKGKEKKNKEKKGKGKGKSKGKDQRGKKRKAGPGFHLDGVQFQGKVVTIKGDWGGSFCMACIEVAKNHWPPVLQMTLFRFGGRAIKVTFMSFFGRCLNVAAMGVSKWYKIMVYNIILFSWFVRVTYSNPCFCAVLQEFVGLFSLYSHVWLVNKVGWR